MMNLFRNLSIKRKLTVITMFTSIIVLLFVCSAFILYEMFMFNRDTIQELSILTEIIANNSTAALAFEYQNEAEEILSALKAKEYIVSCSIYDSQGKKFASYIRDDLKIKKQKGANNTQFPFRKDHIKMVKPIYLDDEAIGKIVLQYDSAEMYARLLQYAVIVIALFIISSSLAFIFAFRLQRIISHPILHLSKIAKDVSTMKDYSIRAVKENEDELGILIDGFNEMLTQIQQRDMALQKNQEDLEQRVEERTEALQQQIMERKRAEEEKGVIQAQLLQAQKMEAIGVLAGGVAHDFNNLLTAIQGCTNLVMEEIGDTHRVFIDLKEILIATKRATDLTHQLLLFSRKQPMKLVLLDLNKSIENMLSMFDRLLGENIEIQTEFGSDLWTLEGDRGTIEQVVMNLMVNARDAMPKGGTITLRTENVIVDEVYCKTVPEARIGRFVRLSVSDTGFGIDPEIIKHIFEPFFTTKGVGKGTGLGLSVIYGIVKQHNGWIDLHSEKGKGSDFNIYLPVVSVHEILEMEERSSIEGFHGEGEKILVVEDEKNVREFAIRALTKYGYHVFSSSNLEEARTVFQQERGKFNLIFSDVVLPDGSGIELVNEFLDTQPKMQIILTSGYTDQKSQWPIITDRGFPFLQKPYSLVDLLRKIRLIILHMEEFSDGFYA